ncbi:hypothetical protein PRIPAC_78391, partial [Pristionchus pacificus]|uniref:G protein-coupled receptor n=1 Tax=Pristionchus pacificus TaxID=54126 RepID=A0A2A6CKV7_PRIPA
MYFEIIRAIHNLACTCAVLFNIAVVILIIMKTPKKLRSYSIILANFATLELVTAISSVIVQSRFFESSKLYPDSFLVLACSGPCKLIGSTRLCLTVYSLTTYGHSHIHILLAFSFCFPYYIIKYSNPPIVYILISIFLVCAPTAIVFGLFFQATLPLFYCASLVVHIEALTLATSPLITMYFIRPYR